MTKDEFQRISKAVADPTRFKLLQEIAANDNCTCSEIKDDLSVSAATLSHHLRELQEAGLVQVERDGRFVRMTLDRDMWKTYLKELSRL
jgi:ArsR family transcriptional regulator